MKVSSNFSGVDKSARDAELEAEILEPLELSVEKMSGLGVLRIAFNRELSKERKEGNLRILN